MNAPLDDPIMSGFVEQIDRINTIAEQSPGFVWRLIKEDGNATSLRVFDDPFLLINMSVWESIDALKQYVYNSGHTGPLKDRKQWFSQMDGPHLALWWIPAGQTPTIADAKSKLDVLNQKGPSPEAFTFKESFPPPTS